MSEENTSNRAPYEFYGKMPLKQAIPLGLQHVLAMFVGNLTPLLIICGACGISGSEEFARLQVSLLQNAMFVAGVVTLVQLYAIGPIGGKVPIIMGTSSGFIGVFKSVADTMVLIVILIVKHWTKGLASNSAILIGIIAGYAASVIMGLLLPNSGITADGAEYTKAWVLNWNKVAEASWISIPEFLPVKPVFDVRAIAPILIMFIVTAVETVGDISGVIEGGMDREATDKELSGGVICDGIGSSFAALFGILPNTSFSQNVGLVTMTKIVNRTALASGAVFLILCGLIPKLGAIISIMPQAVLGGAAVMMFSSIVVSGIQLITKEHMTPRNLTIVSVALGVGYGMGANTAILAQTPQAVQLIFGGSGIVPAALVAILLNLLLPKDDKNL